MAYYQANGLQQECANGHGRVRDDRAVYNATNFERTEVAYPRNTMKSFVPCDDYTEISLRWVHIGGRSA